MNSTYHHHRKNYETLYRSIIKQTGAPDFIVNMSKASDYYLLTVINKLLVIFGCQEMDSEELEVNLI